MTEGSGVVKVMIAGGTPTVRTGLTALLLSRAGFEIADGTSEEAVDVIIAAGVAAAAVFHAVPVLAIVENASEARELIGSPWIGGVLSSEADGDQVAAAAMAVAAGLTALSPAFALLGQHRQAARHADADGNAGLSQREVDVLMLIADGLPNKAIATKLGISENTVKFHVGSILGKLGAASRAEAVMLAARKGLLTV